MQIGDTQIVVDQASLASSPNATNTAFQSPASTQNTDKNASSGLNSILNLASQGAQIAGSIRYQRQQSGASGRRQSLIAQCGRRPLFGRERKAEYEKCKADYQASLLTPVVGQGGGQGDVNKNIGGQGGSMRFVLIGVGVLAIGAIAYLALKKK
jgi:hypothetical protein